MDKEIGDLVKVSKGMLAKGQDLEQVIRFLRKHDCSKVETIRILMDVQAVDLAEAKRLVHCSRVWADVHERDDAFHDLLEQAASVAPDGE